MTALVALFALAALIVLGPAAAFYTAHRAAGKRYR